MELAKWKFPGLYSADANKVSDEIFSIGETATPEQILEKAKDPETELHKQKEGLRLCILHIYAAS